MPTYDFRNKETGEIFERFLSFSGREEYLQQNPHLEQILLKAPNVVSGVSGSSTNRVPDGFKEVLSKVAEAHPTSEVGDRHGRKSIKQARTDQVVKKHVQKITGVKI